MILVTRTRPSNGHRGREEQSDAPEDRFARKTLASEIHFYFMRALPLLREGKK